MAKTDHSSVVFSTSTGIVKSHSRAINNTCGKNITSTKYGSIIINNISIIIIIFTFFHVWIVIVHLYHNVSSCPRTTNWIGNILRIGEVLLVQKTWTQYFTLHFDSNMYQTVIAKEIATW